MNYFNHLHSKISIILLAIGSFRKASLVKGCVKRRLLKIQSQINKLPDKKPVEGKVNIFVCLLKKHIALSFCDWLVRI